jgi:hypothetical protein
MERLAKIQSLWRKITEPTPANKYEPRDPKRDVTLKQNIGTGLTRLRGLGKAGMVADTPEGVAFERKRDATAVVMRNYCRSLKAIKNKTYLKKVKGLTAVVMGLTLLNLDDESGLANEAALDAVNVATLDVELQNGDEQEPDDTAPPPRPTTPAPNGTAASPGDSAERKQLTAALQGVLSEEVGRLPAAQREALVPLFNEAKSLATDGDLAQARLKVADLKQRLAAGAGGQPQPAAQPNATPWNAARPTGGPQARPAQPPAAGTKALQVEIMSLLKGIQPSWPDAFNQLLTEYKQCLDEKDPAQRQQRLQAVRDRVIQVAQDDQVLNEVFAPKAGQPAPPKLAQDPVGVQQEIMDVLQHLSNSPLSDGEKGQLRQILAGLRDCLKVTDPGQKLQRLQALRGQALQLKTVMGTRQPQPAAAPPTTSPASDEVVKELQELLPELFFAVPAKAKEFRDRFNKARDANDPAALKAILAELTSLPALQQYKQEGPAKARQALTDVKALAPEDVKGLAVEKRIDLLQGLRRGGGVKDPDCKSAMEKLFQGMDLEPEFKKANELKRQKVLADLKADPIFKTARSRWTTLGEEEKLAVLKKAQQIQCAGMGVKEIPFTTFKQGPQQTSEGKTAYLMGGFFQGPPREIMFNTAAPDFNNFDEMFDTVIHENTHNHQCELIEQLEAGLLPKGSPEYNQAVLFQLNTNPLGYLGDGPAYEAQPKEQHAWLAGGEARKLFAADDVRDATTNLALLLGQIESARALLAKIGKPVTALQPIVANLSQVLASQNAAQITQATLDGTQQFNAVMASALGL